MKKLSLSLVLMALLPLAMEAASATNKDDSFELRQSTAKHNLVEALRDVALVNSSLTVRKATSAAANCLEASKGNQELYDKVATTVLEVLSTECPSSTLAALK